MTLAGPESTPASSDLAASSSDDALLRALARADDVPPGPEAGAMLGRFRLERVIGRGGMGVVWAAWDERLARTVAIKLLHASHVRSPTRRKRFLREAKAAAAVEHPGVARILEVGEDQGTVFLVFECVEGETLRAVLSRGPLPFARVVEVGTAICSALEAAHAAAVVHRDLKPDNVVCTADGGVKILDFGLAKHVADEVSSTPSAGAASRSDVVTLEGQILGSPGYMAPEQALGRTSGAASDVFSLGVVLFEMTTGRRPFVGSTSMEILVSASRDPAPDPASWGAGTPMAFRRLVQRCLAKDPAERPSSAGEVERLLARSKAQRLPGAGSTFLPVGAIVVVLAVAGIALRTAEPASTHAVQSPISAAVASSSRAPTPSPPAPVSGAEEPSPVASRPDARPRPSAKLASSPPPPRAAAPRSSAPAPGPSAAPAPRSSMPDWRVDDSFSEQK